MKHRDGVSFIFWMPFLALKIVACGDEGIKFRAHYYDMVLIKDGIFGWRRSSMLEMSIMDLRILALPRKAMSLMVLM